MNPAFAARLPFEMFYRVRDVNLGPIDFSVFERAIHDFPSGTNKWLARHVFVIAWLFANQHHRRNALDPGQTRFGSRVYINGMRCTRLPLRERRLDLMCLAAEPVAHIRHFLVASAYESNFALRLSAELALG